ncbi:hypothetical protein KGY79_05270, partial [Candidatus Bipolaricaulota bacterium]|nr:hypothetical protein [Candidatus Bipolaricaulota bacterium]
QVEVSAQVLNRGSDDTRKFYVRLYVNGNRQDYKPVTFGLDAGKDDTVTFTWTAQPGQNELKVVVDDPFDKVDESNEDNNTKTLVVMVNRPAAGTAATDLNIAVVSFEDKSNSGFANVSNGLADMLKERLVNSEFNVLERQEIESILFEQQLNPSNNADLAAASSLAGADAIVTGSVTNIDITESKISLGFLSVTGATVRVNMSYRVISAYTGEILSADSTTGKAEGQTSASFNLGAMIGSVSQISTNVCAGGLRTDKNVYAPGEVITAGYLDPNPPSTFTIQFFDPGGFSVGPPMFSNYKSSTFSSSCVTWSWNPTPSMTPGNYSLKLYDSWQTQISATNFTISAGANPPAWVNQITFGTKEFSDSVVGEAVEKALSTVSASAAGALNDSASALVAQRKEATGNGDENGGEKPEELKCRVISLAGVGSNKVILGGITGNCGKKEGINIDDIFDLYLAESVKDPDTGELIEVIPKTEEPKGKVVILDVHEKVCEGQLIGSFEAKVGDLAIPK